MGSKKILSTYFINTLLINTVALQIVFNTISMKLNLIALATLFLGCLLANNLLVAQTDKALKFDGENDYLNRATTNLPATEDFTIETWVRLDRLNQNPVIYQEQALNPITLNKVSSKVLIWDGTGQFLGEPIIVFGAGLIRDDNLGFVFTVPVFGFKACEWNHVAGVLDYDEATASSYVQIFINGVLAGSTVWNAGPTLDGPQEPPISSSDAYNTELGRALHNNESYFQGIDGALDNVAVWKEARTAAEIVSDMDKQINLEEEESNLLLFLDFEQIFAPSGIPAFQNKADTTLFITHNFNLEKSRVGFGASCNSATETGVIYVNDNATGANNGTSWANAFTHLQDALCIASAGSEIRVGEGIYTPNQLFTTSIVGRSSVFEIHNGISLVGGFPDGGGESAPINHPTILSGNLGELGNSYNIINLVLEDTDITMDGFTIAYGNATVTNHFEWGAAINARKTNSGNANLTLKNCQFLNNQSTVGGAIFMNHIGKDTLGIVLENCHFEGNKSMVDGGALFIKTLGSNERTTNVTITDCTFLNNEAMTGAAGVICLKGEGGKVVLKECQFLNNQSTIGGAIFISHLGEDSLAVVLENCQFEDNKATIDGGALFIRNSGSNQRTTNVTLTACSFLNNEAMDDTGALQIDSENGGKTNLTITKNSFIGNKSLDAAGVIRLNGEGGTIAATIEQCLFSENSSQEGGGVFYNDGDTGEKFTLNIINSIFETNHTGDDNNQGWGGVALNYGRNGGDTQINYTNCTFFNNSALMDGAISADLAAHSTYTNCIIWGNNSENGEIVQLYDTISTIVINHSIFENDCPLYTDCSNIISTNPLFTDALEKDFTLQMNSPAIDAGTSTNAPIDDYLGNIRSMKIDIGAYEYGTAQNTCPISQTYGNQVQSAGTYTAQTAISSQAIIEANYSVTYQAGTSITLAAGFHAKPNCTFLATIESCEPQLLEEIKVEERSIPSIKEDNINHLNLTIAPNPSNSTTTISYQLSKPSVVSLALYDLTGKEVKTILNERIDEAGIYGQQVDLSDFPKGLYFVRIQFNEQISTKKLVIN